MATKGATRAVSWFANWYDFLMAPLERQAVGVWRQRLVGRASGQVLEVGVGTGANLPFYPSDCQLLGVEPSEDMLARARQKVSATLMPLQVGSAEQLEFPDDSFDTVVATLVLCSVADPLKSLEEMRRVLRPGGRLLLLEHVAMPQPAMKGLQDAMTPLWKRTMGNCHLNRDTAKAVEAVFGHVQVRSYAKGLFLDLEAEKLG